MPPQMPPQVVEMIGIMILQVIVGYCENATTNAAMSSRVQWFTIVTYV